MHRSGPCPCATIDELVATNHASMALVAMTRLDNNLVTINNDEKKCGIGVVDTANLERREGAATDAPIPSTQLHFLSATMIMKRSAIRAHRNSIYPRASLRHKEECLGRYQA
jgi:hypothetical protein